MSKRRRFKEKQFPPKRWEPPPGSKYVLPKLEAQSLEALRIKHGEHAILHARLAAVCVWLMRSERHAGDAHSAFAFYQQHMWCEGGIPRVDPRSTWGSPYAKLPDDDRTVLIRWGEELVAEWERDGSPGRVSNSQANDVQFIAEALYRRALDPALLSETHNAFVAKLAHATHGEPWP